MNSCNPSRSYGESVLIPEPAWRCVHGVDDVVMVSMFKASVDAKHLHGRRGRGAKRAMQFASW